MKQKPNILFLMSDEHRADVTGYEGNGIIRTPVLDELARSGIVFSNAYTPSPICIPGRQSMMAGQFPTTTGCQTYGQDLPPGHMTFARRFAQYGYSTVVCGKLHHLGSDQMQGWTWKVGDDSVVASRFIQGIDEEAYSAYPGSENSWNQTEEIRKAGIGYGPYQRKDEYTMQGTLNVIEEYFNSSFYDREKHRRPILLKVSLLQPHYPFYTSESKFTYYLNRVTPYPEQEPDPLQSMHRIKPGVDASPREIRRATAAYYGMVETVDERFGTVLDALRHVGQDLDDWIIIYTSDHGEMLGEHGVWMKNHFYEGSARVPLIIRWPRRFACGRIVEQNVNLCDLFATLCDMADIPLPDGLDSRSLVPLINGDATRWSNETISQFGKNRNLMIKRDHLKYQYFAKENAELLFDLQKNPEETTNYIHEAGLESEIAQFRLRRQELGYGLD